MTASKGAHRDTNKSRSYELINNSFGDEELGVCIRDSQKNVTFQNKASQSICGNQVGSECTLCPEQDTPLNLVMEQNQSINGTDCQLVRIQNHSSEMTVLQPISTQKQLLLEEIQKRNLTQQELKIANLLIEGMSNSVILKEVGIQKSTLKTHLNHIYQKAPFLNALR
jgi:ATP/maltotriose-dependent transcriptional regulator MalT